MKRRDFSMGLMAVAGAAVFPTTAAWAATEGKDYLVLPKPAPVAAAAPKIEVVEFFSYGCNHCMTFEPMFENWLKKIPQDVAVRREHVGFNSAFEPLQRLYYTIEAMGLVEKLHAKIFEALQKDKIRIDKEDVITDWVVKQGVDKNKFQMTYKSFGVSTKIKQAIALQQAYAVEGTPAFGIAGKYYTDPSRSKGFPGMLNVADTLIARERGGK